MAFSKGIGPVSSPVLEPAEGTPTVGAAAMASTASEALPVRPDVTVRPRFQREGRGSGSRGGGRGRGTGRSSNRSASFGSSGSGGGSNSAVGSKKAGPAPVRAGFRTQQVGNERLPELRHQLGGPQVGRAMFLG